MTVILESTIPNGEDYPKGEPGDLAVGYYKSSGAAWALIPVKTRHQADAKLREVLEYPDILHVVLESGQHQGRGSAVAWIARCDSGVDWTILEETEGMKQYRPFD